MSRQISMGKIVDAVLAGIKKSQKQYEKWSNGAWLWEAPEYLITVNVANKIAEIDGAKYITLEHGSKSTVEEAGARGKGRLPKDIRERGRVDILLWRGRDEPRAVIEIKRSIYNFDQYEKDIKRIKQFLNRNRDQSSLQFGLLGYYDSADDSKSKKAKQKIQDKSLGIKNKIKETLGEDFYVSTKSTKIYEDDDSAWCASCVIIKHKTT